MDQQYTQLATAFHDSRRIASGSLPEVARRVKAFLDQGGPPSILIFDDHTSELIEMDFRGTVEDVLNRLEPRGSGVETAPGPPNPEPGSQRGPGRPRLGVVSREVTLLPRHWDWLGTQPGGASVTLRKLVEDARRKYRDRDRIRRAQEVAFRFMSAMAGDLPGFEEATRALYARDPERFGDCIAPWPVDVREHAGKLAEGAFLDQAVINSGDTPGSN